ncbi:MAG: efflux RND transporter periplasmic adaptor subunit [Planctomycetia bacterium]|nr:efflux RND transporter periplasmic adaptor subunit [Planctomycetia bacterium]
MLQRKSFWAALLLVTGGLGCLAWWFTRDKHASEPAPDTRPIGTSPATTNSNAPLAPVNQSAGPIAAPVAATGEVTLESKGYIIPAHQILVSPKVNGMIISLRFEEGLRVRKGDVLAELESIDYKADVARATAVLESVKQKLLELQRGFRPEEIAASKAELAEAEAQRDQLYLEWKRNVSLRGNKTVTERDYEQSESAYKAMDRRVDRLSSNLKLMQDGPRVERIDVAKAEVLQAEADLAKAEWKLGNCTIVAPISGTILKKNAEEGNVVNPIAFNGSFSLCEMADLSDLEVDLSIQERDIARVHKGQKCKIRAEAFSDRVYDGVVSRLMPIADRAKGAVPVRVKLAVPAEEEGVYLKPEMSAVVSFLK